MQILIYSFASIFFAGICMDQNLLLQNKFKFDHTIDQVSIDQSGKLYMATSDGNIQQYDPSTNKASIFSPSDPGQITVLEAWLGLRIFTFQKELQSYRLINRNLSLDQTYNFPIQSIGYVEIATSSFDNNIWLVDQSDFSLKKLNIQSNTVDVNVPLSLLLNQDNYEILYAKEYQNRLFISTKQVGILVFDSFGNYLKTLDAPNIGYFNFWKDHIYFLEQPNSLKKTNLYNYKEENITLPQDLNWDFLLIFNESIYLVSGSEVWHYK